ncbi:translation initiation factor eIF2B delta subunit [Trypanosoma theileri]|uniref:Translation initiation factor eIF2B subunit delta n=1 Tax=Trypanosoma theileri TaxID=67003 RepID=A0A1X0P4F2_9TRYP|nr:translation initiation factor eIF2B delta subunit [Trypanosoma theileri]ORC91711.1 translation initiation factor eIF2B delta subunit [Trypanosoma theileri]
MSASTGASVSLVGQDDDQKKAIVRVQRDLKRKNDSLRKLEKKMKSMKEDDAGIEEKNTLLKEISELESMLKSLNGSTNSNTTVPAKAVGTSTSSSATPDTSTATKTTAPVESKSSTTEAPAKETSDSTDNTEIMEHLKECINRSTNVSYAPFGSSHLHHETSVVHYQIAEFALMMESMTIVGVNARTFAMIEAFRNLLKSTPVLSGTSFRDTNPQDFEHLINVNFEFIRRIRAPSAGMTHVKDSLVRRVVALLSQGEKAQISTDYIFSPVPFGVQKGTVGMSENDVSRSSGGGGGDESLLDGDPREMALNVLAGIEREMQLSIKSIVEDRSLPYLSSNDTILVFGRSSTVELILLGAASNPRLTVKPKVIVIDSAPLYEGRALARRLTCSGLNVTYALIAACCTLMPRCTRVFIGAAAVLQNGDVFNRCGTAGVVASAKRYRKPVLCFAESFKFVPEVWLGNLGQNTKLIGLRQFHQSEDRIRSPSGWTQSSFQSHTVDERHWDHRDNEQQQQLQQQLQQQQQQQYQHQSQTRSGAVPAAGYLYDLTPAAYIDTIICEMGCLHTSAIVAALQDREDRDAYLISQA